MPLFHTLHFLWFLCAVWSPSVYGYIYVIEPSSIKTCHGGQACSFEWLDNGQAPLLTAIGLCYVALYNGEQTLIQQIEPIDVATVHSLQFTPNPAAGPDSSQYYINFTSVSPVDGVIYNQYTSFFRLDQMSGSFESAIPSLTSLIPVPSSLTRTSSSSTITPTSTPSHSSFPSSPSNGMSISRTSSFSVSTPSSATGSSGTPLSNSSYRYTNTNPLWILICFIPIVFGYL